MAFKPYRCGIDCRGGYNCLVCLFVFNLKKISKKIKKIRIRKDVLEKTLSTRDTPIQKKD